MKRKRVKCSRCGAKYKARLIRCPACEAPNPIKPGLSGTDRLVGIILIVIGVVLAVPAFWLFWWALRFGSFRGRTACTLLLLVPVGSVFHGILLLCGIHPKDFYSWWDSLSDVSRGVLWGLLAIVGLGLMFVFFFGGVGSEADVGEFQPELD